MIERKHLKYQEIPFLIDGTMRIVKSVNKYTTCNDVINKLPKLHAPLFVYESVDGEEKKLSGKTKLLKTWRAHGPSRTVEFVVRTSETSEKANKHRRGLFSKCEKPIKVISAHDEQSPTTTLQLKQVSDLAFYVRYQKSKIHTLNRKSSSLMDNTSEEVEKKIMNRITSNASVNSMDAFLAKADLDNMARILSFCGKVTAEKLGVNEKQKPAFTADVNTITAAAATTTTVRTEKISKGIIGQSLKTMKLGLKQKFSLKDKSVTRATSTGTISSADTGYHSVKSESSCRRAADEKAETSAKVTGIPKHHMFIDADLDGVPRHSTPVKGHSLKRTVDDLENTLSMPSIDTFDETDGKNVILQKFMADQIFVEDRMSVMTDSGKLTANITQRKRRRADRSNLPAFTTQEEKCRFYWNSNCDSDSDSCCDSDMSGDSSKLDEAFVDSLVEAAEFIPPRNRTLRRDSANSNLAKFSLSTKPISLDESTNGFDYSFNCTFPRMDESQSVDFSFSFDDNDSEEGLAIPSSDESMDSFMKTRSILFDSNDEVEEANTKAFEFESGDDGYGGSDEGLGSMTSGSVSDCQELMI